MIVRLVECKTEELTAYVRTRLLCSGLQWRDHMGDDGSYSNGGIIWDMTDLIICIIKAQVAMHPSHTAHVHQGRNGSKHPDDVAIHIFL